MFDSVSTGSPSSNESRGMETEQTSGRRDFSRVRRIVVKVGTSLLTQKGGEWNADFVASLSSQIVQCSEGGRQVALVSSGAIRTGMVSLGLKAARSMPLKQAAAAVGQGQLMAFYQQAFARYGKRVAQVLLTRSDLEDRERFLNARNTFLALFDLGAVPIVNENDTVAVDEIKFGDNDNLAALVALVIQADLLVLLSDIEGFYLRLATRSKAQPLSVVDRITPRVLEAAEGTTTEGATGGMTTKLQAARTVTGSGIPMVLADGRKPRVLQRVLAGEEVGTLFLPRQRLSSRKRWIAFGQRVKGRVIINEGARVSLVSHGKSLLPVGVVAVAGRFDAGDPVSVVTETGQEVARGLANYSSDDAARIAGLRSARIAKALGYKAFDEMVHRDNLVVTVAKQGGQS